MTKIRILFSFLVVCNHFFSHGMGEKWIVPLRTMAVPVFFILAFYFTTNDSMRIPPRACKQRLLRILVPFWFWGIVFAPIYVAGFVFSHKEGFWDALRKVVLQLAFGYVYNFPLWFLFALAILTAGWFALRRLAPFRRYEILTALCFAGVALFFQYVGWNRFIFGSLDWHVRFPLGRLVECIPFAAVGIVFSKTSFPDNLRRSRFLPLHLILVALLCWPYRPGIDGFGYGGIWILLSGSALTLFFLLLPLGWLPECIRTGIEALSRYSLGIYCLHLPVGSVLMKVLSVSRSRPDPLFRCLFIWIVCWVLSAALVRLSPRMKCMVS